MAEPDMGLTDILVELANDLQAGSESELVSAFEDS